ncbi:MAG: hypothetical protein ACU0BO_09555 [Limimaricola soesokkakensis]|uniref:hypothetical protein n=2 Tax=Limimaricola soesokkakensis TaxID=1343159 RepID=UPI0040585BB1
MEDDMNSARNEMAELSGDLRAWAVDEQGAPETLDLWAFEEEDLDLLKEACRKLGGEEVMALALWHISCEDAVTDIARAWVDG